MRTGIDNGNVIADIHLQDGLVNENVLRLLDLAHDRFGQRRPDLLAQRLERRKALASGTVARPAEGKSVRAGSWSVDALHPDLLDRRVEVLGGTRRNDLIEGLNSGARSYVADLWNLTGEDAWDILRAHRNLVRAAQGRLSAIANGPGRTRVHPDSTTRLILVPRPLSLSKGHLLANENEVAATFFDIVLYAAHNAAFLLERQHAVLFQLRDVHGHGEAGLLAELFDLLEDHLGLPSGSILASVMIDSVSGALEAEEILHELRHHSYGLAIDPQAYAADHIALFTAKDRPPLPDRETIGLNAPFLRSLSLSTIGIAHRRGAHAIGAPAFVLPADEQGRLKAGYLDMLADKEREAVDGHDGTIVGHPGLVNAALTEFNKSMPTAHQMSYQRREEWSPEDLVRRPMGSISVESLLGMLRTVLQALGDVRAGEPLLLGGRIHDRSSIQLSLALLWQWVHSEQGVITASGLDIHGDLLRYLVKKEADKLMVNLPAFRISGKNAGERLLHYALDEACPTYGTH